jgi:uncharacterized membrane protein
MTLLGAAVLVVNAWLDLTVAVCAIGAGLFAYGVNRLIGEWRVTHDPKYARQLEIANQDERLAYIADKSRSLTLIITVISLAVLGIVLQSAGMKSYGYFCLYIMCGISVLYFIIYQVLSRRY